MVALNEMRLIHEIADNKIDLTISNMSVDNFNTKRGILEINIKNIKSLLESSTAIKYKVPGKHKAADVCWQNASGRGTEADVLRVYVGVVTSRPFIIIEYHVTSNKLEMKLGTWYLYPTYCHSNFTMQIRFVLCKHSLFIGTFVCTKLFFVSILLTWSAISICL